MPTPLDSIDTIVVVMMENRSFDHVLGFLSHEAFDASDRRRRLEPA